MQTTDSGKPPDAGCNNPPGNFADGELYPWLLLTHLSGLTSRRFNQLLSRLGSVKGILDASREALQSAGLDEGLAAQINAAANNHLPLETQAAIESALRWQAAPDHHLITLNSPEYPALLRDIPDPPPMLYVAGKLAALQAPLVAMVGSRRPTVDGRRNARRFAGDLSRQGLGITSGLATGIDAESHVGALDRGGRTVAVLGTGIDTVYPACNRTLFSRLAEQGALVSEFNLGMQPRRENFPRRNRIISGLSLGVLVVEAGLKSGSMITARFALEQGRDVFAIPGSIHNPMARGCHRLLQEGARLVQEPADVMEECALPYRTEPQRSVEPGQVLPELGKEAAVVLAAIGSDPVLPDIVVRDTGLDVDRVSAALVELEVLGLVCCQQGSVVRVQPD